MLRTFFLIFLILFAFCDNAFSQKSRKKLTKVVFIYPVDVPGENSQSISKILYSQIKRIFIKSKIYIVTGVQDSKFEDVQKYNEACSSMEEVAACDLMAKDAQADVALYTEIMCSRSSCRMVMTLKDMFNKTDIRDIERKVTLKEDDLFSVAKELAYVMLRGEKKSIGEGRKRKVLIESEPEGANIIIDGEKVAETPKELELPVLTPISLTVEVDSSNYAPTGEELFIPEGKTVLKIKKILTRSRSKLKISTEPLGAAIYINGKRFGSSVTPETIAVPTNEKFTLTLKKKDFIDIELDMEELPPNSIRKINKTLTPFPGFLYVSSIPRDSEITVDGHGKGETPKKIELTPGRHKIVVSKKGYESEIKEIRIFSKKTKQLKFSLKKSILSDDEKAELPYYNKMKFIGATSYVLSGLSLIGAGMYYKKSMDTTSLYEAETDPFKVLELREQAEAEYSKSQTFFIGSVGLFGIGYIFRWLGEYPPHLKAKIGSNDVNFFIRPDGMFVVNMSF